VCIVGGWLVGRLVCVRHGRLDAGMLVCWYVGMLVCWYAVMPLCRYVDMYPRILFYPQDLILTVRVAAMMTLRTSSLYHATSVGVSSQIR
jgi:hypothetical protein